MNLSIKERITGISKRLAAAAIVLVFLLLVYDSASLHAASLNTFDPDTWSVDFTYNGYFSGWNGTSYTKGKLYWGACTEIGSAITEETSVLASGINRYYVLPASRSENGYFKFEDSFIYTDPNTLKTKHYDIVVYAWSETSWSSTSDSGIIVACDQDEYKNCQFEFSTYAWVNALKTYANGAQTAKVSTEWHFYETGTDTEASVSGIFYLNDNDTTEGYKILSSNTGKLYVQEENVMTIDDEGYVVGTEIVSNIPEADIYAVFSSSPNQPFQLGYKTSMRLCSHPISKGYSVSYSLVGDIPDSVTAPDDFFVSRFINTKQGADALFPEMTAAGYSWNGWYTSSSLTGTKYAGTTSTRSNVIVYSSFTKLYGALSVTKEIDTGQLDVEKNLSGFVFHLYGTSDAGDEVDLYAVTDDQGYALYENVPVCTLGYYQLEEVSASNVKAAAENGNTSASDIAELITQDMAEYVTDYTTMQVTIPADDTNEVTWTNYLKQWQISITKLDSVILKTGQAATGASLKGAVYGLYHIEESAAAGTGAAGTVTTSAGITGAASTAAGTLVASYATDENGQFTTDYQICGEGWYLQEISPSPGYELDDTIYYIDASADLFDAQYNTAHLADGSYTEGYEDCVLEEEIYGRITIIKYGTGGCTLAGVTYELQDTSGEVLEKAITDTEGQVVFDNLLPGEYVICETQTVDGYTLLAEPISVSLPYTLTADEADTYDADTSTAVWNLGLENDSSAEGMYLRMAEVIQANMRKVTNTDTYSMKLARLYFQLKATMRVEPLMITLPYFNGYDNNLQTNTDWCTYEITVIRGY